MAAGEYCRRLCRGLHCHWGHLCKRPGRHRPPKPPPPNMTGGLPPCGHAGGGRGTFRSTGSNASMLLAGGAGDSADSFGVTACIELEAAAGGAGPAGTGLRKGAVLVLLPSGVGLRSDPPPQPPPPPPSVSGGAGGTPGVHWIWGGGATREVPPPPSRAPSLCPATAPLTPSASFNGIRNRQ